MTTAIIAIVGVLRSCDTGVHQGMAKPSIAAMSRRSNQRHRVYRENAGGVTWKMERSNQGRQWSATGGPDHLGSGYVVTSSLHLVTAVDEPEAELEAFVRLHIRPNCSSDKALPSTTKIGPSMAASPVILPRSVSCAGRVWPSGPVSRWRMESARLIFALSS